jgi:hypothetical protein
MTKIGGSPDMRTPLDPEAGAEVARDVCGVIALAIVIALVGWLWSWSTPEVEDDGMLVSAPAAEWRPWGDAR